MNRDERSSQEASPLPSQTLPGTPFASKRTLLWKIHEVFGINKTEAIAIFTASCVVLIGAILFCIYSAPSSTLTITCGPEGSVFYTSATKYATVLARQGVKLKILTSHGSIENLERLKDPSFKVDVGFVQDGLAIPNTNQLVSLGSVSYQPLMVFYRGEPIKSLSDLTGKQVVIGPEGSGTRNLAVTLLEANGIEIKPGAVTSLLDWDSKQASQALLDQKVDAVFLMGEDVSTAILHQLIVAPDIHLLSFPQAEAYTRRFNWLNQLKLPEGSIDLGKDIPAQDVYLIGPTIELVARKNLHPALSDVLLEAAQEVHGKATLLQNKGEFPAPMEHDFPLSADALRFYHSGKSFFYHHLPFWLASLTSRIVVVFIPTFVIMIPVLRSIPQIYRWRIQSHIYHCYHSMLAVEKDLFNPSQKDNHEALLHRLDEIEKTVNKMKVPSSFADQFYALRGHLRFVRSLISKEVLP